MLRKTIRQAAESAGILAPTMADAQAAAERRRQDLTSAQQAVDAAGAALDAEHDKGTSASIQQAEAALADARLTADRAQLAYAAAERRLNAAREADADKVKAAATVKRDAAVAAFTKSAAELDRLAVAMAEHAQTIDAQYAAYAEAKRDHVAGDYHPTSGGTLAKLALDRAIAARSGAFTGDKPSAGDLAQRVTGAVLSSAHG
jgi:hypothetical protein